MEIKNKTKNKQKDIFLFKSFQIYFFPKKKAVLPIKCTLIEYLKKVYLEGTFLYNKEIQLSELNMETE
ncbi:hypothetical protein QF028_002564 [Neobacillus sp. B4I6]